MGFRFYRRVRLGKGLSLNLSKRGISTSFGVRGLRFTVGRKPRVTIGLPGTGLSYTATPRRAATTSPEPVSAAGCLGAVGCVAVAVAIVLVAADPWLLVWVGLAAVAWGAWRYITLDIARTETAADPTFGPPNPSWDAGPVDADNQPDQLEGNG